jgi:hypothetical protein
MRGKSRNTTKELVRAEYGRALEQYNAALRDLHEAQAGIKDGLLTPAEYDLLDYVSSDCRRAYERVCALGAACQKARQSVEIPPAPNLFEPSQLAQPLPGRFTATDLTQTALLIAGMENERVGEPYEFAKKYFGPARDLLMLATTLVDLRPATSAERRRAHAVTFDEILASTKDEDSKRIKFLPGIHSEDTLKRRIREFAAETGGSGANARRIEGYISKRFLPLLFLAELRKWRRGRRRDNAKGRQKTPVN